MEGLQLPTKLEQKEEMRRDAHNQFRLAAKLYISKSKIGMKETEKTTFADDVLIFWTTTDKDGNSYSKKYRLFVQSNEFKFDPRFKGDISSIELEDFIN